TLSLTMLMTMTIIWLASADPMRVGNYWEILAGSTLTLSHVGIVFALTAQLYGIRERYRTAPAFLRSLAPRLTLETMLVAGLGAMVAGVRHSARRPCLPVDEHDRSNFHRASCCSRHDGDGHPKRLRRISARDRRRQ